jgi:hypothetical protein
MNRPVRASRSQSSAPERCLWRASSSGAGGRSPRPANHFNSKGGDDPLFGRFQPRIRRTEVQHHQQAAIVLDQILVTPKLFRGFRGYDSVHVNAEFHDQDSDHDPQLARFKVGGDGGHD